MPSEAHRQPRVVVIGAGAIGSVLGVALADAGYDVTVGTRSARAGITVEDADGRRHPFSGALATDPRDAGRADVLLVTTKVQDARSAASAWFGSTVDAHTSVVVVQNGVDHLAQLEGLVEEAQVVPAPTYISAERAGGGVVVHHAGDTLVVPAVPRAIDVAALFEPTRVRVQRETDFLTAAWRKLLTNVVASPITTLTGRRMDVFGLGDVRTLAEALLREAVAAGLAIGAQLGEADVAGTLELVDRMPPESGSSMLADREAGRPLEHEFLTGAVVRTAAAHDVATPLNGALLDLLRGLDDDGRSEA